MIYRAIGIMSGSSLDGLDIAYVVFEETGGRWNYEIITAECASYSADWAEKLYRATALSALDYQLLHTEYGHYIGENINRFIAANNLAHKVHLIASHGHTTFHLPQKKMSAQLGDGAAIAAVTQLPVISDLRSLDVAFGGQGAPIVPIGHKLLFNEYDCFLNIGGIANISLKQDEKNIAFDICPANRVLNMLVAEKGLLYDDEGKIAAMGNVNEKLLQQLNELEYYMQPFPKSLPNSFGMDIILPMIRNASLSTEDALRTYVEHIAIQISRSFQNIQHSTSNLKLLVTGGGAFNSFLIERLSYMLDHVEIVVPEKKIVEYKEALIMALIGVLRWREEVNVLSSVTGASQNSIGGALWIGNTD
ncbi:anhydro-N-acetylmuramic acid kinase [Ferruginibacter lapsinanis]|uniref:anhydro-N-acetylmuramic acid kinase n=1 Tax=Ferruginibacter lapsinanis TaxID=563172 RepID=UPI001E28E6EE|nr:anhydro-N-acetylmuramic acid kinase [Ferruginibacter lapsinanis]UEG51255.1 anhydro-N-acetylmuramic acid kinase [Ferruginibacter lapsinanis]